MAITKTTTPIRLTRAGVALLGLALAGFAVINLFMTMTPTADRTERINSDFEKAQALPAGSRHDAFRQILDAQANNLAQRPSDPYGWARLSYLRLATTGNQQAAFSALVMSDFVSPYEAPELPERAMMWERYRNVENSDQQAYQDALWRKAYSLEPELTWKTAIQSTLVNEVGESLKRADIELYGSWAGRISNMH